MIERLLAYVTGKDQDEGVLFWDGRALVAFDEEGIQEHLPAAMMAAQITGQSVYLVEFRRNPRHILDTVIPGEAREIDE